MLLTLSSSCGARSELADPRDEQAATRIEVVVIDGYAPTRTHAADGVWVRATRGDEVFEGVTDARGVVVVPYGAVATSPWDVTFARPGLGVLSVVEVRRPFTEPVALYPLAASSEDPVATCRLRGAIRGYSPTGRAVVLSGRGFASGPLGSLQNAGDPPGEFDRPCTRSRVDDGVLQLAALELDTQGMPVNLFVSPAMPSPVRDARIDVVFPQPAAAPTRTTLRVELPERGPLARDNVTVAEHQTVDDFRNGWTGALRDEGDRHRTPLAVGVAWSVRDARGLACLVDAWTGPLRPDDVVCSARVGDLALTVTARGAAVSDGTVTPGAVTALAVTGTDLDALRIVADTAGYDSAQATLSTRGSVVIDWWRIVAQSGGAFASRALPALPHGTHVRDYVVDDAYHLQLSVWTRPDRRPAWSSAAAWSSDGVSVEVVAGSWQTLIARGGR